MKINRILAALALSAGFLAVSCEDSPTAFVPTDGIPVVDYVRYADRDLLIEEAYLSEAVCIVGENLTSVNELYFNDQPAVLNTSYITNNTLVVTVPKENATVITDLIYLITAAKDTVTTPFHVMPPAPEVVSMDCEYTAPGKVTTIHGEYFIDLEYVEFQGVDAKVDASDLTYTPTSITLTIPANATAGMVKVKTKSGLAGSKFQYQDKRGMITNFDGMTDVVPQGWNIAASYGSEGGLDGQYCILGPAKLDAAGGWQEALKLPFWCGNWNGDPMSITAGPGVPLCNIIDFSNFNNMALKFELNIPKENPWSSGAMQFVFTSAEVCANDSWQNNTYIHTVADGGLGLCRGLYRPWEATGSFDTNGEWITVTVPIVDFKYDADGKPGTVPLSGPQDFASFILWPWSGGVSGTECNPIFKLDNLRVVPF